MVRHFLSIDDLSTDEVTDLLELSEKVKAFPQAFQGRMDGLSVAMIFEKPSTRTRVSFEVGVAELGGHPVPLVGSELQLGRGETIEDTGRVLSRYVDAVVVRTFGQERLEALTRTSTVPVINALSDFEHPCQCLADLMTINPVTVHKDRLAVEVLNLLERHRIDDLVVVDDENVPVGIVDSQDLTRLKLL